MHILLDIGIWFATAAAMEGFAYLSHKYIMHGWGWKWHASHHTDHDALFERNDLYAVVFAIPSALMIYLGAVYDDTPLWPLLWIGAGTTTYGFMYFIVHDGLVHNRWPWRVVPRNKYMMRLVQAHRMHHAVHGKDGCVSFGFLVAPEVRKLKEDLRAMHGGALANQAERRANDESNAGRSGIGS